MTFKQISTLTCDGCGKAHTTQNSRFGPRMPAEWAEIEIDWTDGAGERHFDEWHLCPECAGDLLAAMLARRPAITGGSQ